MSRKGNCCDNASMENFWGVLKNKQIHPKMEVLEAKKIQKGLLGISQVAAIFRGTGWDSPGRFTESRAAFLPHGTGKTIRASLRENGDHECGDQVLLQEYREQPHEN